MKYIGIECPYTEDDFMKACDNITEMNDLQYFTDDDEHRLLINVTHGALSIYKDIKGVTNGTNIMITDFPLRYTVQGMGKLFDIGINAVIPTQLAMPNRVLDNKAKHHNRLHFLRANIEISQQKGENNWALLLDDKGHITEFTGANIFMIKNGVVFTTRENILEGISRRYVMDDLCPRCSLKYVEADIVPYNVSNADECFATGTPFCILPVTFFNGQPIGKGAPGPVTNILIETWSENVGVNIVQQIKSWNAKDTGNVGTSPYSWKK
jgi:branched-chain amino acid aminotransferase